MVLQLNLLRQHESVAEAAVTRRLCLHGWYHDLESGRTTRYEPARGAFVPV